MSSPFAAPSVEEQNQLLEEIGPIPVTGPAWPKWVKLGAWFVVAVMALQIGRTLTMQPAEVTESFMGLTILFCFLGLAVVAFYMQRSVTTIDAAGIRQTWLLKRDVPWSEIQFAKFVPLLLSRRLVIFTRRGRPIVIQGGTKELHIAFAHISLVYRRRSSSGG